MKIIIKLFLILKILKTSNTLKILILTQNQAGLIKKLILNPNKKSQIQKNFKNYEKSIKEKIDQENPDLIIYNIQEIIELKAKAISLQVKSLTKMLFNFAGISNSKSLDVKLENEIFKKILIKLFPLYNIKFVSNISMSSFFLFKKEILGFKILENYNFNENGGLASTLGFNNGFWGHKGGQVFFFGNSKKFEKIFYC